MEKQFHYQSDLVHYTDPDLRYYFEKFNKYTSLAAEELAVQKKGKILIRLIVNPIWIFIRMYIVRWDFLMEFQD